MFARSHLTQYISCILHGERGLWIYAIQETHRIYFVVLYIVKSETQAEAPYLGNLRFSQYTKTDRLGRARRGRGQHQRQSTAEHQQASILGRTHIRYDYKIIVYTCTGGNNVRMIIHKYRPIYLSWRRELNLGIYVPNRDTFIPNTTSQ